MSSDLISKNINIYKTCNQKGLTLNVITTATDGIRLQTAHSGGIIAMLKTKVKEVKISETSIRHKKPEIL
jgi:sugar diacid utilization regulator